MKCDYLFLIKSFVAASLTISALVAPADAQQLISNPGIEGDALPAEESDIHISNRWGGDIIEFDSFDKWWTAANGEFGHSSEDGNPDGHFSGNNNGFINRFQIIDNTENQYSGPATFSLDRRWYEDDLVNDDGANTFLGAKWRIWGVEEIDSLPTSLDLLSGGNFGNPPGMFGDLLAEYNVNDINAGTTDGDGIMDTGNFGTEWDTQTTAIDLGNDPYDFIFVMLRAGSTNPNDVEVPVSIDNISLTLGVDTVTCDPNSLGDLDGNGTVEFADFLALSANFGTSVDSHELGDIDCNGEVEFADFLVLSANFGTSTAGAESVPEPSGMALLSVATILLGMCRRRR